MTKTLKRFRKAEVAALLSTHEKRMGAVVYKRTAAISIGWNSHKTHTRSKSYGYLQHAEFAALLGVPKAQLVGSEIYVLRLLKNGRWAHSRPCEDCQELLKNAGVKRAWFIDTNGKVRSMKL